MGQPGLSAPRVVVGRDLAEAARLGAQEVVARAQAAASLRGRFTLALSGGHTPQALHALLADPVEHFRGRISWAATHVFFGDERCVPPDHPDSNYGAARRSLLAHVPLPASNVHRLRGEDDPLAAAATYEAELRRVVPVEPGLPRLDLILLGLGADGHTASLFPGTPRRRERGAAGGWLPAHVHVPAHPGGARGGVPRRRRGQGRGGFGRARRARRATCGPRPPRRGRPHLVPRRGGGVAVAGGAAPTLTPTSTSTATATGGG